MDRSSSTVRRYSVGATLLNTAVLAALIRVPWWLAGLLFVALVFPLGLLLFKHQDEGRAFLLRTRKDIQKSR